MSSPDGLVRLLVRHDAVDAQHAALGEHAPDNEEAWRHVDTILCHLVMPSVKHTT